MIMRKRNRNSIIAKYTLAVLSLMCLIMLCACGADKSPKEQFSAEDKAMRDAFEQAEIVYSWFAGCGELEISSDEIKNINGDDYALVTQEGISCLDDLRKYADRFFTAELSEKLMNAKAYDNVPLFCDIEGSLYIYSSDNGLARRDIGECVGHVTASDDTQKIYSVDMTYKYYNESVSAHYDYVYVLCDDGKWRFSTFELPAILLSNEMFG